MPEELGHETCAERLCFLHPGSTYACLSIAAERFLGICYPTADAWYRKFRFYVIAIFGACILIDAPRFFEVRVSPSECARACCAGSPRSMFSSPKTVTEPDGAVGFEYSDLRTNPTYIVAYIMWYRLLTTIALPFGLMMFFNLKVFTYYKRNRYRVTFFFFRFLGFVPADPESTPKGCTNQRGSLSGAPKQTNFCAVEPLFVSLVTHEVMRASDPPTASPTSLKNRSCPSSACPL